MAENGAIPALPLETGADADKALLRNHLVTRIIYPLGDAEDPQDFVALDAETGAIPKAIGWHSTIFWLDPDDSTTAHDGTTVLVTDDGYRYKIPEYVALIEAVLDKDLTAPPGGESFGDAYLVPAGATGDWSGKADKIAVYTARGWKFVDPQIGQVLYVEDEAGYYHYSESGSWEAGLGNPLLPADSVLPANILGGISRWLVENQTTNAPPSVSDGVAYIIGSSPTGAWAGHAGKIALSHAATAGGWIIITPVEGYLAYDKTLNLTTTYNGSAWAPQPSGWNVIEAKDASSSSVIDFTNGLNDTYDDFQLICTDVALSVDGAELLLRVGTGVGPTYQTSGYQAAVGAVTNGIALNGNTSIGNDTNEKGDFRVDFSNPEAGKQRFHCHGAFINTGGSPVVSNQMGRWNTAATLTGIRIIPTSGNITSGHFVLMGKAKS